MPKAHQYKVIRPQHYKHPWRDSKGLLLPRYLKSIRKSLELTVPEAAYLCHVHPRTWHRWESEEEQGRLGIPENVLELFCMKTGVVYPPMFDIAPGDLIDDNEDA